MPYIQYPYRVDYDDTIIELQDILKGKPVGECNYVISRIVWKLFNQCPDYVHGNALYGMLLCVAAEFYRRKLAPFWDEKIKLNGDLPEALVTTVQNKRKDK